MTFGASAAGLGPVQPMAEINVNARWWKSRWCCWSCHHRLRWLTYAIKLDLPAAQAAPASPRGGHHVAIDAAGLLYGTERGWTATRWTHAWSRPPGNAAARAASAGRPRGPLRVRGRADVAAQRAGVQHIGFITIRQRKTPAAFRATLACARQLLAPGAPAALSRRRIPPGQ